MKEAIKPILELFENPKAKVAALAIMCVTVVLLASGCTLTASGVDINGKVIDDIAIEIREDF